MAICAQELSQIRESIAALTTAFQEFTLTQDLRHKSYMCMFQNLQTLHIKSESSSPNQSIVNVLPLSDVDEAKKIDNDGLRMYLGDEIEKEPNPNDNFDSTVDSVSNSIKDMVDDTTFHSSNFSPQIAKQSLPFHSYDLRTFTVDGMIMATVNSFTLGLVCSSQSEFEILAFAPTVSFLMQTTMNTISASLPQYFILVFDPDGCFICANYNLEDKVVVDGWSNDMHI